MPAPSFYYDKLVQSGSIKEDLNQRSLLFHLDKLHKDIMEQDRFLSRIFRLGKGFDIKGYYIYGKFGCGKSLLLNCFYDSLAYKKKYYNHFSTFLELIKQRLFIYRGLDFDISLSYVFRDLFSNIYIYCLDECIIRDISDAMIFGRIFDMIFSFGGIIVSTSNFSFDKFSPRGANSSLFDKYKSIFFSRMHVYNISSDVDYRLMKSGGYLRYYYNPLTSVDIILSDLDFGISSVDDFIDYKLDLGGGRYLYLYKFDRLGLVSYNNLLDFPYGYNDFKLLSRVFRVLILDNMVRISSDDTTTAKRFIMLLDCLYDSRVRLVINSSVSLDLLYSGGGDIGFEFNRALSRLQEMQSIDYLKNS